MEVVCCAKKIHSVVCVCMGTCDAIDKKGKNVLFCSFLSCTVGGVQLWSLAEATYCKYDHFDIPFTVWWLTWLHADSYTITHLIFWTQCISPFMHGSTILSPGSKCCCVHLALMLSCIFDFVAHWMGENAWVERPSISGANYYFPHGQICHIWPNLVKWSAHWNAYCRCQFRAFSSW